MKTSWNLQAPRVSLFYCYVTGEEFKKISTNAYIFHSKKSIDFLVSSHATGVSSSPDAISLFSITIIRHLHHLVLSEEQKSMVPDIYK